MRYKNNVLDKLTHLGTIVSRVDIQINRGGTQNDVNESIEQLKEQIESIREMVSIEPDEFEQQFAPRQ
jgi:UV DNA damage repair endonuclease